MSSTPLAPSDQPSAGALVPATSAGIARAAQALRDGHLAILPTETVYGIAVNLHSPDARRAARAIKAAATGDENTRSPWVLHLAQAEDVLAWVPHLSPIGRRLVTKAMPGPVAFQIKLHPLDLEAARRRLGDAADETLIDGEMTFRVPELGPTQGVLASVEAPVAIIGAGTAAQPGVFEASDIPASLLQAPGGPQVILDGGPTRYRRSSTLVRIDGEQYAVLRPGVIDERIIHKFADMTIVFVCSGNTCRSPMAAALAATQLAGKLGIRPSELPLRHIVVQSAGLHAARGMRAALEAVDAVKPFGADLTTHLSQPATPDLLRRADAIYTMTDAHREEILELVPGAEKKTFRIDPDEDVADPIGSNLSVYQQVASRLNTLLQQRLGELSI
jgi:protein-tyrosine-phosphatase/tRNA A37 threonylcarbamoyladenosine synthetase subunit TsaC/SUA5/YrdC